MKQTKKQRKENTLRQINDIIQNNNMLDQLHAIAVGIKYLVEEK